MNIDRALQTYYVSWLTPREALDFDRRIHNVPDDVTLGWTPYTIRVTRGALPVTAFTNRRDFKRWLRQQGLRVASLGRRGTGLRFGTLEAA